jgi:hypothetical protein
LNSEFHQEPYLSAGIYLDYLNIPLMDDYLVHIIADVIRLFLKQECLKRFAPDPAQVFQVLDLSRFGIPKRCPRYELTFDGDNAMVKFILKLYHDFRETLISLKICGALPALGCDFHTRIEPYRLLFKDQKLRGRTGFQELWSVDFPLDESSGDNPRLA